MRAIAVAAVVLYHMEPTWLPGGYFGVDIFFVISGYLITSMLGAEWAASGKIDLRRFWLRRVRRLYPAVVTLVVILIPVAAILAPTSLASMRTTIPAALVYLTNWWFIYHHVPYFQTFGRPPLLIHFWSLAIEEQYYLVWPPILALLLTRWRRPARIAVVALIAALFSSVLMALLYHPGADVNRIYYGSDTHAQGLLLGSALGLVIAPSRLASSVAPQARRLLDLLGGGAIAALAVIMVFTSQSGGFTWRGGMVLVVILAGIAVIVAAHPASHLSVVLGSKPMRWMGTRSYSIYLWHWPILELTRPHLDVDFGGLPLGLLRVALIGAASELSYRYIERPWRRGQAQRVVRDVLARGHRQRQAAMAGAGCIAIAVVALVVAAPSPKPPPSIAGGATSAATSPIGRLAALPTTTTTAPARHHRHRRRHPRPTTTTSSTVTTSTSTTSTTSTTVPTVAAIVKAPAGRPVLAIGDSVMLGSSVDLSAAFGPAITVDAEVGRQVYVGLERLQEYKAAGRLRGLRALVIGLGTNGPFEPDQMRQLIALCRGIPNVVLINVRVPDSWQSTSNDTIESVAHRPGFTVVDWYSASANPALLYPDQTHPDPAGQVVYTNLVVKAVTGR
jgi:peptidoglycan/LPS O-acetylase OafA/YrhL